MCTHCDLPALAFAGAFGPCNPRALGLVVSCGASVMHRSPQWPLVEVLPCGRLLVQGLFGVAVVREFFPVREHCRSAWGSESRKRCAEARLACFVLNTRSGSDHWRCSPRVGLVGLIRKRPYWNRGGGLISGPAALPLLSRAAVRGLDHGCWFSLSSSLSFSPWTSCSFGC